MYPKGLCPVPKKQLSVGPAVHGGCAAMQGVQLNLGLAHRLLVAAARAHYQDGGALDWPELAHEAAVAASPKAIGRALASLAEDGLIEGVFTPAGWLDIRPTARGLGRAGRSARRPAPAIAPAVRESPLAAATPAAATAATEDGPAPPLEHLARERVADGLSRARAGAIETRDRVVGTLSPRL